MTSEKDLIKDLTALNQIAETLNRAVDMSTALDSSLTRLIELIGLETGWIFLKDPTAQSHWSGRGYRLAAYHNLPPALTLKGIAWQGNCSCQKLGEQGKLTAAFNQVRCSRLLACSTEDRCCLEVHASTPLRSGERVLGILNVASKSLDSFTPESLALLTNVGNQMGIALDRARLFDLLQERRIHELSALLDFSNQLLSHLDLNDLMKYLTKAVCDLLQADACAVVLPMGNENVLAFQAASGWYFDPVVHRRQIPADISSSAGLVMHTQHPLLVEDLATNDPTPWNTDWMTAEGFRGHAVVPLIVEGRSIGTLVIDNRQPRIFNENELQFLRLMANQAALAIEKSRLHHEEIERLKMEEELAVAHKIQLSLLPETLPTLPGWEFSAVYRPARAVSGDFYDCFELPGRAKRLGIIIADVSGKGVPAALFMSLSRSIIRTKALTGCRPSTALSRANVLITRDSRSNLYLTACYALLDVVTGRLVYVRAGHNFPLWWHAPTSELRLLNAKGIILGAFESVKLEERTIDLTHGDIVVFYTDGVTEAINANEELFGEERLYDLVRENSQASAPQLAELIAKAVDEFVGDTLQSDDCTLFLLKRLY